MKPFTVGYFKSDSSTRSIFLSRHQYPTYIELKLCALKQVNVESFCSFCTNIFPSLCNSESGKWMHAPRKGRLTN